MDVLIRLAEAWWPLYVVHFVEVSLFILLVWTVDYYMTLDTRLRYVLYLLALAKVFVPPFYAVPLPEFLTFFPTTPPDSVSIGPVYAGVVSADEVAAPVQVTPLPLTFYLFCLWGVSVLVWAGVTLWKNAAFHHALSLAVPVDLARKVGSLDGARDLKIYAKASLRSPLLFGIVKPRLYLPSHWSSWAPEELRGVIAHELAHRDNRDIWVLIFQGIATALFCVNPLIWLLNRRLTFLRELRCDEAVLRETNLTPAEYGRLLFGFVNRRPALSALYFNESGTALKKRLEHVLNFNWDNVKRSRWQLAIPILIGLAIVPFSIREAYTQSSQMAQEVAQTPASGDADSREGMELTEVAEKPEASGKGVQEVAQTPVSGDADSREGMDVYAEEAIKDQVEGTVSPTSVQADSREKHTATPQTATADSLSASADADTSDVLDFNRVETMPEVLHDVDPVYPEIAKNAGLNDKVFLKFMVNVDGSVSNVSVVSGVNIFRQPAIDALSQWRFEPAKHKGKAVPVWMVLPIAFRLPESPLPASVNADTSGVLKKTRSKKGHIPYLLSRRNIHQKVEKKETESQLNVWLMLDILF